MLKQNKTKLTNNKKLTKNIQLKFDTVKLDYF